MKTLAKSLFLALLVGLVASFGVAQSPPKSPPKSPTKAPGMSEMMAMQALHNKVLVDLKLSPDQMKKIEAANVKLGTSIMQMQMSVMPKGKDGAKPTEAEIEAAKKKVKALEPKVKQLRDEHQKSMKTIMGDKKFAEYQKNLAAAVAKFRADAAKKKG